MSLGHDWSTCDKLDLFFLSVIQLGVVDLVELIFFVLLAISKVESLVVNLLFILVEPRVVKGVFA